MKILLLDIETAPNTVFTWGLWDQNVAINQIIESSYILSWAAKWYGEKEIFYDSIHQSPVKSMLKKIHILLDEADAVIHFNGTSFDIPTLNKEFIIHGFRPPAPYKQMDMLQVAKKSFRFASNKLDFISGLFKLGNKKKTDFTLWINCMKGDEKAWEQMESYNKRDVVLLEKLYEKFKPWIYSHANHSLYTTGNSVVCPNCGSDKFQRRGFHYTSAAKYQRYQCTPCGTWFRSGKSVAPKPDQKTQNLRA